ncbi:MAG: dolichyl-phosphate beta-glucosyltransferase [Candidatus Omnitrophota bacterium]
MSVSVIVPSYNEEELIEKTVNEIHAYLSKNSDKFEIILVDDGSTDSTLYIATTLSRKLPNIKVLSNNVNCGKGYSVRKGMLEATSEYALFTDADLSTPIDELDRFIPHFNNGAEIIIGSRALKNSRVIVRQSLLRKFMGNVFNVLAQLILCRGIKDTQCGFKCFKSEIGRKLACLQRTSGFAFDAEILFLAKKHGYKVHEVPVTWRNRKNSRVTLVMSPVAMFLDLLRIRINDARGVYELK